MTNYKWRMQILHFWRFLVNFQQFFKSKSKVKVNVPYSTFKVTTQMIKILKHKLSWQRHTNKWRKLY